MASMTHGGNLMRYSTKNQKSINWNNMDPLAKKKISTKGRLCYRRRGMSEIDTDLYCYSDIWWSWCMLLKMTYLKISVNLIFRKYNNLKTSREKQDFERHWKTHARTWAKFTSILLIKIENAWRRLTNIVTDTSSVLKRLLLLVLMLSSLDKKVAGNNKINITQCLKSPSRFTKEIRKSKEMCRKGGVCYLYSIWEGSGKGTRWCIGSVLELQL